MLLLWRVYSQLQPKYGVGKGGAVVDLGSSEFWRRIGDAWTGSSYVIVWLALAAAALAGLVMLAMRDRRAALILGVWLVQPVVLLSILTATSPDFAPERHLSFMIPAYVAALATFLVEVGRRAGRYGPWLAALLTLAAITPGVVALSRDVGNFTPDLRHASLYLGSQFGSDDVLLSTGGVPEPGVDARLYGAYAALDAVRQRLAVAVARRRPGHGLRPGRAPRRRADSGRGLGAPAHVGRAPAGDGPAGEGLRSRGGVRPVRGGQATAAAPNDGGRAVGRDPRLPDGRAADPGHADFAHLAGDYRSARRYARHPELCS